MFRARVENGEILGIRWQVLETLDEELIDVEVVLPSNLEVRCTVSPDVVHAEVESESGIWCVVVLHYSYRESAAWSRRGMAKGGLSTTVKVEEN